MWPDFCAISAHWTVAFGPEARTECAEWLERHWQDIQPVLPPSA
ncbi:MbtH family NRPS accessory protein [Serratia symbiotica]